MQTFKVLNNFKPNDDVLKMITNTKPISIKISNGQALLIERTNIKSVEPIICELTYSNKVIVLWEYPTNEIQGNHFYIPTTKEIYKNVQINMNMMLLMFIMMQVIVEKT